MITKNDSRKIRHNRVRAKISGTSERPRLSVFKSNKYMYAQLINDEKGETIVSASSLVGEKGKSLMDQAREVGQKIAEQGKAKGVTKVVFDKSGYMYAGRIKALADSAREGGLKF